MAKPEWLMFGYICKIGIIFVFLAFYRKWKGKMIF